MGRSLPRSKPRHSLKGYANIADEGSSNYCPPGFRLEKGFADGHAVHAPVRQFKPNGFGLHNMHGNVSEWTRDWVKNYEADPGPVDGFRGEEVGVRQLRASRGGSKPVTGAWSLGVRPARAIER